MGRKCAVLKCRSGYTPTADEKVIIETGGDNPCAKSVFRFPANEKMRGRWLKAIARYKGFANLNYIGVCELHFKPDAFNTFLNTSHGKQRSRTTLKANAVPTVFKNYPKYLQPVEVKPRTEKTLFLSRQEEEHTKMHNLGKCFLEKDQVKLLDELWEKIRKEKLPEGFTAHKVPHNDNHIITIKLEKIDDRGAPKITHSMSVFPDLTYKLIYNGLPIHYCKVTGITAKSGFVGRVSDVQNLLARLKYFSSDKKDIMMAAAELLDTVADSDEHQANECRAVAKFTAEQLRLVTSHRNRRRYSSALMTMALIWEKTSPKLYQDICSSDVICLPSRSVLRRLTSALNVKAGLEEGTMTYLKMRFEKLEPRERLVNIALDEVYSAQAVELSAGKVTGETLEGDISRTLFCAMINSVAGRYEDMISMTPVQSITADKQQKIFLQVLQGLTEIGYQVVSVTTDGHKVNAAFQSLLGVTPDKPWFANPFLKQHEDKELELNCLGHDKKIYVLYDSVHLWKNAFYQLLNNKKLVAPPFPGSESQEDIHVNINHLVSIYNKELGMEAKMAHRLTDKVLNPSAIERTNVQLVGAATHESTTTALVYYADKCNMPAYKETAAFLRLVRKWFTICNVKTNYSHCQCNDPNRKPVTNNDQESLAFLEQFAEWLRIWQERRDNKKRTVLKGQFMSSETAKALRHTSLGLVELARHLLLTYKDITYVLLGKVQSDTIEGRFGYLRKLAGGNPQPSARQFFEGEAVIRATALCKLSGYTIGEVNLGLTEVKKIREKVDNTTVTVLVEAVENYMVNEDNTDEDIALLNVLTHIAGYCGKSSARHHRCQSCTSLLVMDDGGSKQSQLQLDDDQNFSQLSVAMLNASRQFTEMLNRGKLTKPSDFCVNIMSRICFMWRAIMHTDETRRDLLQSNSSIEVFVKVVKQVSINDGQLCDTKCETGHDFLETVMPSLSRTLFNIFTSNYAKERNSEIHKSKRCVSREPIITREGKKIAKLNGNKIK